MKVIREEDRTRLCFDGELTVHNAAAIREGILQALGQSEEVEIDLEGVTAVDLAGLQLLCSAHRTAEAEGKTLLLESRSKSILREVRRASGFVLNRSCRHVQETDCFWVGGMDE